MADAASPSQRKTALVLSGGGARGAYEAGVVAYLEQELFPELGRSLRFDILSGTSIGAMNACTLAAMADEPQQRAKRIIDIWRQLQADHILSFGFLDAFRLLRESLGTHNGIFHRHDERRAGLVNTAELQALLLRQIPWRKISWNLRREHLDALSIGATHIGTGRTTVFVQRKDGTVPEWVQDSSYVAVPARISARHALASAAIPLLFPPVLIGSELYTDGGLRLNVPLSPALRLGAERIAVVSLRAEPTTNLQRTASEHVRKEDEAAFPSLAFLMGKMLNAVLEESVEQDLDRLQRLNVLLEAGTNAYGSSFGATLNAALLPLGHLPLRQIRTILVRPSRDLGSLAAEYMKTEFKPRSGMASRTLKMVAERESGAEADLVSYMLFDGGFADWLIDLGRRDARARRDDWIRFWTEEPQSDWERTYAA